MQSSSIGTAVELYFVDLEKKRRTEVCAVKVTSQGKNLPKGVALVTFFVSLNMMENMRSERAEGKNLRS